MSIKPVDMQILLPRSQEIQRGEIVKDHKSGADAQAVLTANQKETVKRQKQVLEAQKGEEGKIHDEGQKKGDNQAKQFSTRKHKKEDELDCAPENLGKNIDIKI